MENRYEKIQILKSDSGKRIRKTVVYPKIPKKADDIYIVGIQGDRLDNLAYKYYNDSLLWWIIARANYLGKGDLSVPIGKQIRIPADSLSIIQEYNELNK